MTYTDESYRALPRYSNSDLGELKRGGKPLAVKPETLAFGSVFHTWILEPNKDADDSLISPEQRNHLAFMLARMAGAENDEIMLKFHHGECETVRTWTDETTGLPCKAKLDCIVQPKQQHIIDLKTTSCTTLAKFIDSLLTYDYDRQAAFYLSGVPGSRYFEFVGVQKQPPYQVFRVSFHITDKFIVTGQQKVADLLKRAKFEAAHGGWIPSSWGRIGQTI